MSTQILVTNQTLEHLLVARMESEKDICYFHNITNQAKTSILIGQIFFAGENHYVLEDVMDDYIIVSPMNVEDRQDNSFYVNEDLFGEGDLILTRLDKRNQMAYTHELHSGAKISFSIGQRIQIGRSLKRLIEVTDDSAKFTEA